jgi:hypothetical protein
MSNPMEDLKAPTVTTPQPVMQPGAIDDTTVPDREGEDGADVAIFDRATGDVRYERRP